MCYYVCVGTLVIFINFPSHQTDKKNLLKRGHHHHPCFATTLSFLLRKASIIETWHQSHSNKKKIFDLMTDLPLGRHGWGVEAGEGWNGKLGRGTWRGSSRTRNTVKRRRYSDAGVLAAQCSEDSPRALAGAPFNRNFYWGVQWREQCRWISANLTALDVS